MKTIGGLRKLRHCGGERIDWIVTCTGLYDEPRVGAPRTVSDEQVEAIIVKTLETTPPARRSGARDPWPRRRASVTAAARAIHAYVDAHNERGTPFKWLKTADEILDSMRRFAVRLQQVHGR